MLSKNKLKYLSSLKVKKYRDKEQMFLIEGFRLIQETISAMDSKFPVIIQSIYYSNIFLKSKEAKEFFHKCKNRKIKLIKADVKDIDKLSESMNNQGIIALVNMPVWVNPDFFKNQYQIILDGIADPGNLGNILRTAAWFGLSEIYLSENSIDPYNGKVVRSAMGAHFYINIIPIKIVDHIEMLKENNYSS